MTLLWIVSYYECLWNIINNNEEKHQMASNECNPLHKERDFLSNNSCGDESPMMLQYLELFPMCILFNRRKNKSEEF